MTDIDSILERIRKRLAKRGRKTIICQEMGLAPPQLSVVANPDWNPTANRLRALQKALDKHFPGDLPDPPHQP